MKTTTPLLALALAATVAGAADPPLQTDDDKILYAVGLSLSERLLPFGLDERELAVVERGIADGVFGRQRQATLGAWGGRIDGFLQQRKASMAKHQHEIGQAYLARARKEAGAVTTPSGLIYFELERGLGPQPGPADSVSVQYSGSLPDGRVFYRTVDAVGEPITMDLTEAVPCVTEGLQRMKVGGKSRLVCPPEAAWGEAGSQLVPPRATVIFEVELLAVIPPDLSGS
jgi:FKBP-type peptidyl-prolyl cis-trans isomerase FkpA/FKBP-type peptidyl-prolyl cis-trans isomerase FklB